MRWLVDRGGHIVEGNERPCGVCGLHGFLHLLGHLLHDCVSHGGHEVLERIPRGVGFLFGWVIADRVGARPGNF